MAGDAKAGLISNGRKLTAEEREFWRQAYLAAKIPPLISVAGAAHLAAEYADFSLLEFQRRFVSKTPESKSL